MWSSDLSTGLRARVIDANLVTYASFTPCMGIPHLDLCKRDQNQGR